MHFIGSASYLKGGRICQVKEDWQALSPKLSTIIYIYMRRSKNSYALLFKFFMFHLRVFLKKIVFVLLYDIGNSQELLETLYSKCCTLAVLQVKQQQIGFLLLNYF